MIIIGTWFDVCQISQLILQGNVWDQCGQFVYTYTCGYLGIKQLNCPTMVYIQILKSFDRWWKKINIFLNKFAAILVTDDFD